MTEFPSFQAASSLSGSGSVRRDGRAERPSPMASSTAPLGRQREQVPGEMVAAKNKDLAGVESPEKIVSRQGSQGSWGSHAGYLASRSSIMRLAWT